MSAVTNTTVLSRAALNVKSVLESKVGTTIIDPSASKRSANQPFIRTTRARKSKYYPHITIESFTGPHQLLSVQGDQLKIPVLVQVSVWTKSIKDMDAIFSQVMEAMRSTRSTFKTYGMQRGNPFCTDVSPTLTDDDETHMRAATYQFVYYAP